jgi:LacI family repressor for deo operon, udp, cdd, tsx, nupC, and nupG
MGSGWAAAMHFAGMKDRPTAIFAANDEMAIGLISGFKAHGIECPRDVSVMGFDDINVSSHYAPPLTTMRQPREQIGRIATETLVNILEGNVESANPVRVVLKSELVIRQSTARLASG